MIKVPNAPHDMSRQPVAFKYRFAHSVNMNKLIALALIVLCCLSSEAEGRKITAAKCPQDWTTWVDEHEIKCYFFNLIEVQFNATRKYCENLKGRMVSIHSKAEEDFIRKSANSVWEFWLGLEVVPLHEKRWIDGTPYEYTNWGMNGAAEACHHTCCQFLWSSRGWKTTKCEATSRVICKQILGKPNGAIHLTATFNYLSLASFLLLFYTHRM